MLRLETFGCEDHASAALICEKKPKQPVKVKASEDSRQHATAGVSAAVDLRSVLAGDSEGSKKGLKKEKASKDKAVKSVRGTHLLK